MGKSTPKHAHYEEMQDTPWITQGRQIADIGGKGVLDNYNKVNVFDPLTRYSLDARNNETYKRAFDEMNRNYTNMMNKYNAANYNQFGTLNATAPSYIVDQYRRDMLRQADDLSYNKAANYDTLMDNELNRRYNTLDMYNTMYGYGNTPYQLDIMNWNTRNTNKDIDYNNDMAAYNNRFKWNKVLGGGAGGAVTGFALTGNPLGAIGGGIAGAAGGFM